MKMTKRLSLTFEYLNNFNMPDYYQNPLSIGLDVETGGHVFQLIFSNSQAMTEKAQKQAADMAEAERMARRDPSVIGELIKRLEEIGRAHV